MAIEVIRRSAVVVSATRRSGRYGVWREGIAYERDTCAGRAAEGGGAATGGLEEISIEAGLRGG